MEHFFSVNRVYLAEDGSNLTDVEVLRAGMIQDRGLKITQKMLSAFVQNFKDDVYGTELQVNKDHQGGEAMGWIKNLFLDPENESRLMATIEWTKLGVEKIKDKLYKFVSAEFSTKYPHHKTGKLMDNVFSGLALTNTPALKGQSPIALSEDIEFTNQTDPMFKSYITKLSTAAVVSKEEKGRMRELLEELPEAEQAEHKEAVAAVEAKPEAPEPTAEEKAAAEKAAADKAAAEKAEADRVAAEAAAKAAEGKTAEQLSEKVVEVTNKMTQLEAENAKLTEKIETQELSEKFEKEVMLSSKKTTGLNKESQPSFVKLMRSLSEEQRSEVLALIKSVKTVSLEEIGSTDAEEVKSEVGAVKETDMAEAEKMHKEDATKTVAQHLAEIYRKRNAKTA